MKDIVFIINDLKQPRCIRRVEEFISKGYKVHVFGFERRGDTRAFSNFEYTLLGKIDNGTNYLKRLINIRKAIKENITGKFDDSKTIYYLFFLDIAISFRSIFGNKKSKYIYEISDLPELLIKSKIVRKTLVYFNRSSMKHATHCVFTSEGFLDYYNFMPKEHISIIPNKINSNCPKFIIDKRTIKLEKIRIGFVGVIRFNTLYNFAKVCAEHCKNVELHFYGISSGGDVASKIESLAKNHDNIILHGAFKSPEDLTSIYKNIDMVLSAYTLTLGTKYAEPNKYYEALYFRCPIIVSKNTFLGRKVENLNVGYVIDAMNENEIQTFIESINENDYNDKFNACNKIAQSYCLNNNDEFFKKIEYL